VVLGLNAKAVAKAAKGSWTEMERFLDAAVSRLAKAGLAAEWEIQEGDPRAVILAEAESFRADCVFLGRRGLSGFNRILLGSVSAAVASHAPCSVEVVPG
jgi:nucleotide-binding universal stress UspA family protein